MPSDHQRIEIISDLIDLGFSNKILIGHDICSKHRLKRFGGHGWDHILKRIIPRMKKFGIKTKDLENILINNPREILRFS
jgi:phosphotriesterase-related protein